MNKQYDPAVFSAMQAGDPLAVYQKTILGKVEVSILNPFNLEPEGLLLSGRPGSPESKVSVWSVPEDVFFKRMNRRHFEKGNIISVLTKEPEEVVEKSLEQSSDEELQKLINGKYLGLQNALRRTESEALVYRLLTLAEDAEKSEKLINAIKTRLAELQSVRFASEETE